MRFTGPFAAAAVALSSVPGTLASPWCYGGGRESTYTESFFSIEKICRDHFLGMYQPGEHRYACIHDRDGKRWDFEVNLHNKESPPREMTHYHCTMDLTILATKCRYGALKTFTNWQFRTDPNVGICGEVTSGSVKPTGNQTRGP